MRWPTVLGAYNARRQAPELLESYKPGEYVMMRRNPHYRLLEGLR